MTFAASTEIVSQGTGSLQASGSLTFVTPLLTAAPIAQQITAIGAFNLENGSGPDPDPAKTQSSIPGSSSRLRTSRSAVVSSCHRRLYRGSKSGRRGADSGAVIDVSGAAQQFYDQYRYAPGGQVNLTADLGNVTSAPGTTINVSGFLGTPGGPGVAPGVPAGGDAGAISVTAGAIAGLFTNQGNLLGSAAAGNISGSFVLNVGSIAI